MTRDDIIREIAAASSTEPESILLDAPLEMIPGWDSLALVAFIAGVDERFSVVLDPQAITACASVRELVDSISRQSAN
jgi:acyl carrier protein